MVILCQLEALPAQHAWTAVWTDAHCTSTLHFSHWMPSWKELCCSERNARPALHKQLALQLLVAWCLREKSFAAQEDNRPMSDMHSSCAGLLRQVTTACTISAFSANLSKMEIADKEFAQKQRYYTDAPTLCCFESSINCTHCVY